MSSPGDASLSRRRFLWSAGATGAALWMGQRDPGGPGWSRTPVSPREHPVDLQRRAALTDPIRVERVRGKVSCIAGSGGNIALLDESDGVLLVDSGMVGARVAAAVATVTQRPITHLVNTHWHFDHTDANGWMGEAGATIIAHANTRRHLSETTYVKDFDYSFPPLPSIGRPAVVFDGSHSLERGSSTVSLRSYGSAHTDSDISVRFEEANVLHLGDTWWNGVYPFIDYSTGGGIDGMIAATTWNLAAAGPETLLIPGHGPVGQVTELRRFYEMLVTVRDRVARLKREGRSGLEVIAAKPTASFDRGWGGALVGPEFFTRLVYQGV